MKKIIFLLLFYTVSFGQIFVGHDFDADLVFRETFQDEWQLRFNNGTPTDIDSYNPAVFNGSSSRVNYNLELNGTYSIRVKFTVDNVSGRRYLFDSRGSNGDGNGRIRLLTDSTISSDDGTKYVNGVASSALIVGENTEIVVTGITLFQGTGSNQTVIGTRNTNAEYFLGDYDLLEIYKGTLSSQDVADLYSGAYTENYPNPDSLLHIAVDSLIHVADTIAHTQTPKPTSLSDTNLVAAYNMIPSNGQILVDISGGGFNGTIVNCDYAFTNMSFNGADSKITIGNIGDVKSIEFQIKLGTTTEKILEGVANDKLIHASSGTLTYPDFDNAYINGVDTNAITTDWSHVIITSSADVGFTALTLGLNNTTYGNFDMKDLKFYSNEISESEAIIKYNETL